jgi:uncharacterized protein with HEPN domain
MSGVRDKLIHDYFGVNIDIVWQIARDELPLLAAQVAGALEGKPQPEGP